MASLCSQPAPNASAAVVGVHLGLGAGLASNPSLPAIRSPGADTSQSRWVQFRHSCGSNRVGIRQFHAERWVDTGSPARPAAGQKTALTHWDRGPPPEHYCSCCLMCRASMSFQRSATSGRKGLFLCGLCLSVPEVALDASASTGGRTFRETKGPALEPLSTEAVEDLKGAHQPQRTSVY